MGDVITLNHLGPCDVKEVDDDVPRAARFGVPVVIQQPLDDGVMACAVLADRDVKMACSGCFQRTMRISDTTRCKKCSGFVKHHDFKGGVRRLQCKEGGDAKDIQPAKAVTITTATKVEGLADNELLSAVKSRQLGSCVVEGLCDEDLASAMRARGVEPLIDARPARLIHELRRQGDKRNVSAEACCGDKVIPGLPSGRDAVGADLAVVRGCDVIHKTRQTKKQKTKPAVEIIHFAPKAVGDCG